MQGETKFALKGGDETSSMQRKFYAVFYVSAV